MTLDERTSTTGDGGPDAGGSAPGRSGRPLWVIFGSLLVVAGLGWGTFNIVDLIAHEERTERFAVPAAGLTTLSVDNDNGPVRIVGANTDQINVEADISDGLRQTGFSQEVVGSALRLRGSCPIIGAMWCEVAYRIETPNDLDLDINADNSRVDVSNIGGDVGVNADNGTVELSDVSGSIEIDSDNGSIIGRDLSGPVATVGTDNGGVDLTFAAAPDRVDASSSNGGIEIVLPEIDGGYNVVADTDNGDVDLALNNNPESPHRITVETDNGAITVRTVERG